MARWGHPTPSRSLWKRRRNVTICPVTSCKVQVGRSGGIFPPFEKLPRPIHAHSWRSGSSSSPPPASTCNVLLASVALSHRGRSVRSAAQRHGYSEANGWHEIDGAIGRSSRFVIRHGWVMVLLCVGGFSHIIFQWVKLHTRGTSRMLVISLLSAEIL